MIDEEVRKLIEKHLKEQKHCLPKRKTKWKFLQRNYLKREVLFQSDVEALIGKRPYEEKKALDFVDNPKEAVIDPPMEST